MFKNLRNKMASKKESESATKKTKKSSAKKSSKKEQELLTQVEELSTQLDDQKDKYLRLFAEFDNFKKRTFKENLEIRKSAGQDVLKVILPVLDDFDRAKKAAEDDSSSESLSEGVLLVYNKIYSVLGQKGLKAMETNGEDFDSELHEAISEIPAGSDEMKGKIIDTIEKGYYLNDKIIRHAKVVVGK